MATVDSKLQTANAVMTVAGIVIVGALAFSLFGPKPKVTMDGAARNNNLHKIRSEAFDQKDKATAELAYAAGKIWKEDVEQIGPKVLARATNFAKGMGLNISAFRPQRTQEDGKMLRVPFLVALDGSYPQVTQFIKSMEDPAGRVGITSIQLTSADGVSDKVTATIGLIALKDMNVEKKEEPKTGSGGSNAQSK